MMMFRPTGDGPYFAPNHSVVLKLPDIIVQALTNQQPFYDSMGIPEEDVEEVKKIFAGYFEQLCLHKAQQSFWDTMIQAGYDKDMPPEKKKSFYAILGVISTFVTAWYHSEMVEAGNLGNTFLPFAAEAFAKLTNKQEENNVD